MKTILVAAFLVSSISFAQAKENKSADAQAVDTACTQEATTASCGNEKVGTGLLKCIHAYKKANKDFKISDGCKAAMKTLRADKKAAK
jgi:hypothetical protein